VYTIKAKLVETSFELGGYINYIFQNLDSKEWSDKYVMCIQYPNWDQALIPLNTEGFLTFTLIEAGDTYKDFKTDEIKMYTYTHNRFDKFIPIQQKSADNKLIM
jgi:hypothetical protein